MSKKVLIFVLALGIMMSLAISGIAFADQATPVTLVFFPMGYYYDPVNYPTIAKLTENIVQKYEELHPNVTIKLIPNFGGGADYETWLTAQFVAGSEPDITWQQYYNAWYQTDWWIPLNKYLETPDPYAAPKAGKRHWRNALPTFVWNNIVAPNGNYYTIPLDWVETGLYYNKDIFDKLGIDPNFKTWDQFMSALKIIKEHGYAPMTGYMSTTRLIGQLYDWVDEVFMTAAFADKIPETFMEKYNKAFAQTYQGKPWRLLTAEELAKAVYNGIFSAYDPRFAEALKLEKEFIQYWPRGFASLSENDELTMFLSGKAAIMWQGSWEMPAVAQSAPFKWGLTYLPPFSTAQFPHLPKMFQDVSFRVGGPSSQSQYSITVGAKKRGVLSTAVDFLKYLSTPDTWAKVILKGGRFIPMIKGTQIPPSMAFFQKIASYPTRAFLNTTGSLNNKETAEYYTIMENYLLGSINLTTAQKELQGVLNKFLKRMESENHYEWYK